jgi:hypothetical protein
MRRNASRLQTNHVPENQETEMKIFVSVVSYRDPLLRFTVRSLLEEASPRHKITVGVFEQTALEDSLIAVEPELANHPNVRYQRIDPVYASGVCWARAINALQIQDEEFFYQVDSHMIFDKDWDRKLLYDWHRGKELHRDNKIIISGNCKIFDLVDGVPAKRHTAGNVTCEMKYFVYQMHSDIPAAHGEQIPATEDITQCRHICAGNFFTHRDWLTDVGIPSDLFFEGEEHKMTLTSYFKGWHLYHPRSIHSYHFANTNDYITKHWHKPIIPIETYSMMVERGIKNWQKYLESVPDHLLENYYAYSGMDYINKTIDERAFTRQIMASPQVPIHQIPKAIEKIEPHESDVESISGEPE